MKAHVSQYMMPVGRVSFQVRKIHSYGSNANSTLREDLKSCCNSKIRNFSVTAAFLLSYFLQALWMDTTIQCGLEIEFMNSL